MTREKALREISIRHPKPKLNKGRTNAEEVQAYIIEYDDLDKGFSQFTDAEIDKLIDWFFNEYPYKGLPKWQKFNTVAGELGIGKKNRRKNKIWWYECIHCKTHYSHASRYCPKCHILGGESKIQSADYSGPGDLFPAQEDCSICKIYPEWTAITTTILGPSCQDYGTGRRTHQCNTCRCNACCYQYFLWRSNCRDNFDLCQEQGWLKMRENPVQAFKDMGKKLVKKVATNDKWMA